MPLTKQESDPHPELVAVRCALEGCGVLRREAATICNQLDDKACDAVLAADGKAGVMRAVKAARQEVEQAAHAERALQAAKVRDGSKTASVKKQAEAAASSETSRVSER